MAMDLTIVNEIQRQLYAGGVNKVWSWGAYEWVAIDQFTLRFKVNGFLHQGYVSVFLTPMDVYEVKLIKMDGTIVKTIENVYCNNLTEVIDKEVEWVPVYKK